MTDIHVEIKERHRDNRFEIFVDRHFIGNLSIGGDFNETDFKKLLVSAYKAGQRDIQRKTKAVVGKNGEVKGS